MKRFIQGDYCGQSTLLPEALTTTPVIPLRFASTSLSTSGPVSDGLTSTAAMHGQTSVCSAISRASLTSIPRYRTVLSSVVWPSSN